MKFFCEQCKAKYQIADEKVAGKTVRMKCRKCGHVIELRAEVTETSAIAHAPPASVAPPGEAGNKGTASKAPGRPPPRPSALATSLTSARPAPPRPATPSPGGGSLAGAFKSNVQREEETSTPFDMADLAPGDDWYVAVNGVPVGPIRIAEVRRKAALGAVTEDSLVWQEGLDEWRPLRTFPDLAANVREAAAGGRISMTPPPPDAVRPSSPPPSRSPSVRTASPSAIPQRAASTRPLHTPPPAARSNVVPITSRLATAERIDDAPTEIGTFQPLPSVAPDPFAAPLPTAALVAPPPPAVDRAAGASVPASLAPSPASVTPSRRKAALPVPAIALIAGAVSFGGFAAYFFFSKPPPAPAAPAQTVVITQPAPPPPPTASAASAPEPTASAAPPAPIATSHGQGVAQAAGHAAAPVPTKTIDLGGLTHGATISPGEDPGGGESAAAPGQCLSQGQMQQVIGMHQVGVRRTCWERNQTSKPSVNVSVQLTVGGDGSAQSVSASSAEDSSVAKCIESEVRSWRFPAMGCSQKTAFSFKFVRQ